MTNPVSLFLTPSYPPTYRDQVHFLILKNIFLHIYPIFPTKNNFKDFVKVRLICKKFNEAFRTFYDGEYPSNFFDKREVNLIMSRMGIHIAMEKKRYAEAFILAKLLDDQNVSRIIDIKNLKTQKKYYSLIESRKIQKYLFEILGFHNALSITIDLRQEIREFAYTAFIYEGCSMINLNPHSTLEEIIKIKDHSFINSLKEYSTKSNIPLMGLEHFILNMVNRVLGINSFDFDTVTYSSSSTEEVSDCEIELTIRELLEKSTRKKIALDWLTIIPPGFVFEAVDGGKELKEYLVKEGIM